MLHPMNGDLIPLLDLHQFHLCNRRTYRYKILIRGVHGSGRVGFVPNPDSTRMWRVNKKLTRNWPGDLVGFFGLGLVGFGLIQVGFGFITGDEIWPDPAISGQNLTGSFDIWPKYGRIRQDRTEIWPDPSRSGRNLTGSFDIWPKYGWIRRDLA